LVIGETRPNEEAIESATLPKKTVLAIYPNPFNPSTELSFSLAKSADVSLVVYDVRGRQVRVLQQGIMQAGEQKFVWNGRDNQGHATASGVYLARLVVSGAAQVVRMTLIQ